MSSGRMAKQGLQAVLQKVGQQLPASLANKHAIVYIMGLALFHAWNLIGVYGAPLVSAYQETAEHLGTLTVVSSLTNCASYIVVALLLSRLRFFEIISLCGACLAGLAIIAADILSGLGMTDPADAVAFYRAVGRVCATCTIVAWGMRYSKLDGQSITMYALASFLVASLICLVTNAVVPTVRTVVCSLLLPVSAFLLVKAPPQSLPARSPNDGEQDVTTSAKEARGSKAFVSLVWRAMVVLFLFGIVTWTVILNAQSHHHSGLGLEFFVPLGCLVTVGALLIVSLASGGMFTVSYVYKIVVPFVGIGMLLVATLSFSSSVGPTFVSVGYTCLDLFCFVMVADACAKTGVRAGAAFGWCRAIESGLPLLAIAAMSAAGGSPDADSRLTMLLGAAGVIVVVATVVMDKHGIFGSQHLSPDIVYPNAEMLLFALQCERAIERYGLSAREAEVLGLVVRGRSAPHIAERLSISRSTVKTHIERIYQKFGVSERQEMIDRIEAIDLGDNRGHAGVAADEAGGGAGGRVR